MGLDQETGKINLYVNNEPINLEDASQRSNVLRGGVQYKVNQDLTEGSIFVPAQGFKLLVVSDGSSLGYVTTITDVWNPQKRDFEASPLFGNSEGLAGVYNDDKTDDFF